MNQSVWVALMVGLLAWVVVFTGLAIFAPAPDVPPPQHILIYPPPEAP